jgi:hypothetical protein
MLLVVFGAGASYDSVPHRPLPTWYESRPPLANQLFDDRGLFRKFLGRFSRCQPIIPYLRIVDEKNTVEQVLANLKAEAGQYPERERQLAAVRYYIHSALWECLKNWQQEHGGITNYKTLLDQIEFWRSAAAGQQVCLATFNYDTMLEEAASEFLKYRFDTLNSYISRSDYTIVKLHGSINWGRQVEPDLRFTLEGPVNEIINHADEIKIGKSYKLLSEPITNFSEPMYPALAIPLENKTDFECPEDHLSHLKEFLPKVKKIVTIGWRATERHFLTLLSQHMDHAPYVMSVAADRQEGTKIMQSLARGNPYSEAADGGFSDFVRRREMDRVLCIK